MSATDKRDECYEVTINATGSQLVVRANTIQQLHDQLTGLTESSTFAVIGRLVASIGEDVEAQGNLGRLLDAQPVDPPVTKAETKPEPKATQPPSPPTSNPWNEDTDPKSDGPNLPSTTPPPAPPAPAGGLPPMPKWAQ